MTSKAWCLSPVTLSLLLALAVTISRVFLLGAGYGSNPDAWRALMASRHLLATGSYVPSRFPGYPLPEYFGALLIKLGFDSPFALELPVAILSGVATALFFLLLRALGTVSALGAALCLAFTPVFYIASTEAMDYLYGFTFFVGATLAAVHKRLLWSAVCLGLAAASRPTYALAFLPLALVFLEFRWELSRPWTGFGKVLILASVSGATALLFYAQLIWQYGIGFLQAYDDGRPVLPVLRGLPAEVFGQVGRVGVAVAVVTAIVMLVVDQERIRTNRTLLLFALTIGLIYLLLFCRLPHETSYIIPVLPALYIALAVGMPFGSTMVLSALLLASCFVHFKHTPNYFVLEWRGPVVIDQAQQRSYGCIAAEVAKVAGMLDHNTYIQSGYLMPYLNVLLPEHLVEHLVYAVDSTTLSGYVLHEDVRTLPLSSRFMTVDRVERYISRVFVDQLPVIGMIDTSACAN